MKSQQETNHRRSKDRSPPAKFHEARLTTPYSEYDIIKPLESRPGVAAVGGMNSGIFLIEHRITRDLYVEKRLPMEDDTACARVKSENGALYEIRKAGSCRHIVDVVEAFAPPVSPPFCSLILDYCNSGTLKDFVDRYIEERKTTPEPFAWHIFAGITSALCACHYGIMDAMRSVDVPRHWDIICHLDIKPSNIFLTSTGRTNAYPRVVLGDFGCAIREEDIDSGVFGQMQQVYTPEWLPPENERSPYGARSLGSSYGTHTDVWQAGAVVQAMCRLSTAPNQGLAEEERPCGSRYTFALNNIITCCMSRNFRDRPTTIELVKEVKREMQGQGMLA
jgi:NIMA (never in mitosis gene a)-related kinase